MRLRARDHGIDFARLSHIHGFGGIFQDRAAAGCVALARRQEIYVDRADIDDVFRRRFAKHVRIPGENFVIAHDDGITDITHISVQRCLDRDLGADTRWVADRNGDTGLEVTCANPQMGMTIRV